MADRHRLGTFDSGGRFVTALDLAPTDGGYAILRDTLSITPPAQSDVRSVAQRRYGGSRVVAEQHDNGQFAAEFYIRSVSQNGCLAKFDALVAILEDATTQYFWEWRPDGASRSTYFEVRGASWEPVYRWLEFSQNAHMKVRVGVQVAPLALGDPLDVFDDFTVTQDPVFTNLVTNPSAEVDLTGWASSVAAYPATVGADAPVAYWRLNETTGTSAADSAGTNTGTFVNTPTLGVAGALTDPANTAVSFNGLDEYVSVPDAPALRITGDLTLEAWVKPTDRTTYAFIVAKGNTNGQAGPYLWFLNLTTGIPVFTVGDGTTGTAVNAAAAPAVGVWSHVAVKVSGSTVTHFLNGVPNGTGSVGAQARADVAMPLYVARTPYSAGGDLFKGAIDEVAVYNAALTDARLLAHYHAGLHLLSRASSWAASGAYSARWQTTHVSGGAPTLDTPAATVSGATTYSFRVAYNAVVLAGSTPVYARWSDGSTMLLGTITATGTGSITGTATAPAGATSVTIRAVPPTGLTDLHLDAALVAAGDTPPAYFDGDSSLGAWTGTRHASTSVYYATSPLADYTFDAGDGTLDMAGGTLKPTSPAEKRFYHSARGYRHADAQAALKLTTGASAAALDVGVVVKRLSPASWLVARVQGSSLRIDKTTDGGTTLTQLATTAITAPAASTAHWLRARTEGNLVTAEWFTSEPAPSGNPAATATVTLAGADATTWGAGVKGDIGLRLIPADLAETYDDFRVEPYTYPARTWPTTIDLPSVPGTAPAKVDAWFNATADWAIIGWAPKPGVPAYHDVPFGLLQAESAYSAFNMSSAADPDASNGLKMSGAAGRTLFNLVWRIEPAVLAADSFTETIDLEFWTAMEVAATLTSVQVVLKAKGLGASGDYPTWTREHQGVGKRLTLPPSGAPWRPWRLGTITFPVAAGVWELTLTITAGTATAATTDLGVDHVFVVPAQGRAASASGKRFDLTFPRFSSSTSGWKIVRSDLSGIDYLPSSAVGRGEWPSAGLGGRPLEFSPGDVRCALWGTTGVPDDPAPPATDSIINGSGQNVHFAVTPRYHLARSG